MSSTIFLCMIIASLKAQITVDTSFEGANVHVLDINNALNEITVESVLREGDTRNVVFYFGINGFDTLSPLTIRCVNSETYYLPVLPAYSYDKENWFRISGTLSGITAEFTNLFTQSPVYFAHGYPYVYSDLVNLSEQFTTNPYVTVSDLTTSEEGRAVKLFRFTDTCASDTGKYLLWIIGRNHAMESHSSYVMEGLINFLASDDIKAEDMRRKTIIYIVPMMDVDNAAIGGTGKDRLPVDFNRDWDSPSYWNAVNAVKEKLAETTAQNALKIFLDSHDPFPGSPDISERLYFYSLYDSGIKSDNLDVFRNMLYENGGYNFDRLPMYATTGQTSFLYVDSMYTDIDLCISLETGWINRTDDAEWTIPLYMYNGEVLGKSMHDFIDNLINPGDIILDNTDTLQGVEIIGAWIPSTYVSGYWGMNYVHNGNTDAGSKSMLFTPEIISAGDYNVYLRWTAAWDRATNVPVTITYSGGIKDTIINQQNNGGEWVSLGVYPFTAGDSGSISLQTTATDGYVIADAVRFSKIFMPCDSVIMNGIVETYKDPEPVKIYVYPNPFSSGIHVSVEKENIQHLNISIYNSFGIQILEEKSSNAKGPVNRYFDLNSFTAGIYFFEVKVDTYRSVEIVMKN